MSIDERELFQIAYRKLLQKTRESWRIVSALLNDNKKYGKKAEPLKKYKKKIETKITESCYNVVSDIKAFVLSKKCDDEPRCFFLKMTADFLRYIAEISDENHIEQAIQEAKSAYEEANKI